MCRTAAFLLVFLVLFPGWSRADAGEAETILRFGEELFAERDYYRAITEYKRFLFLRPDFPKAHWVRFRIGESYLAGGQLDAARHVFEELRQSASDLKLRGLATLSDARVFYLQGSLVQSAAVLGDWLPSLDDTELKGQGLYLTGCVHLKAGSLPAAREAWRAIPANHPLAPRAQWLVTRAEEVEGIPRKHPVLAGLLSLVPGLGHLYLGEYAVAITAFTWNGLFGFATYDAFERRSYGVGSLLAALTLLWYSGTVYGAVSGAARYNRDARLNFLEKLDREAGLDAAFPDPTAVGAILLGGSF